MTAERGPLPGAAGHGVGENDGISSLFRLFSPNSAISLCLDVEVLDLRGFFFFFFLKKSGLWTPAPLLAGEGGCRSMGFFAARQTGLQAFAWTAVT